MYQNELYHYGVKGMKWGVRKSISSKVSNLKSRHKQNKKIKKRIGSINKEQRKRYANTDISKLSDNELRTLNQRIELENQYKTKAYGSTNSGKVRNLINFGKDIAVNTLRSSSGKLLSAVILTTASAYGASYVKDLVTKYPPKGVEGEKDIKVSADEASSLWKANLKPKKG